MISANIAMFSHSEHIAVKHDVRCQRSIRFQMIARQLAMADSAAMKLALGPLLSRRGVSQTQLADAIGKNKSFISEIVSGKKSPSQETLLQILDFLDADPSEIYERTRTVPVVGKVGAGARISLVDSYVKGEGLYRIACPPGIPSRSVVAVEVVGDSMAPMIEEGDLLVFTREFYGVHPDAIDKVALCETSNGDALVKLIRRGRDPGQFDLFSVNAAENHPIYGAVLKWAAPYRLHIRKSDVRLA